MPTVRLLAMMLFVVTGAASARATLDLSALSSAVRQGVIDDAVGATPAARRAKCAAAVALADRLGTDGTWPDVDYANASRGAWPSVKHVDHILELAAAGTVADSPAVAAKLNGAAIRATDWWRAHDPKCLNWWYNEIGVPSALGRAALVLGERLPPADIEYVTGKVLPRARRKMSGTNLAWLNGNLLYLGLLTRDASVVQSSLDAIFSQAVVTEHEGIQADFSYHQHGAQQQFGNYGLALLVELAQLGREAVPAGYVVTDAQRDALRGFALDGEQWTCWRGMMDVNACGRQLFPGSAREKARAFAAAVERLATLCPADKTACDAAAHRDDPAVPNDLVGDRYFWRSDYGVHRRPAFMATVRMCSTRVLGNELVNSENLSGYHTATGTTFFYTTGHEYEAAMPLLDWRKLPGVTCPWSTGPMPAFGVTKNASDFVGGACDGTRSAIAFDLRRDGVSAAKAYFFLGDSVACLGADIRATGPEPIVTTLDQFLCDAPSHATPSGVSYEDHGLRYELLTPGTLSFDRREKSGSWSTVFRNGATPKAPVTGTVATLWIDHGVHPADAAYAYRVCLAETAADHPVRVMSNTSALQAVEADGVVGAVLRSAGAVAVGTHQVKVDQPCALLADPATGAVTVADPTHKVSAINISCGGEPVVATLPTGGMAGRSVTVKVAGL
jgi:chondroitin AC lyase